jgi:hypothetical protein
MPWSDSERTAGRARLTPPVDRRFRSAVQSVALSYGRLVGTSQVRSEARTEVVGKPCQQQDPPRVYSVSNEAACPQLRGKPTPSARLRECPETAHLGRLMSAQPTRAFLCARSQHDASQKRAGQQRRAATLPIVDIGTPSASSSVRLIPKSCSLSPPKGVLGLCSPNGGIATMTEVCPYRYTAR